MAMAMAALMARLRNQVASKVPRHPLLPDLVRRALLPTWMSQEQTYATRSMPSKSRGAWEKCGKRGDMDNEDYGYAWDDHEMGFGREAEIPHYGKKQQKEEKKKKTGKKSFKLRTEKCLKPFSLDVFLSGKYIHASVMHRVTSKVVAVCSTNAKEFRNNLKSYKDFTACKVVGETLAQRAKEADVFTVVYEPRKGEKFEGRLAAVVHTIEDSGINVDMD